MGKNSLGIVAQGAHRLCSSRYDTHRYRAESGTLVSPHMHTHTYYDSQWDTQSFLFFMVVVWPMSESHSAQRFLIRGAWDRDTASPCLHLFFPADEQGFHRERRRDEYFHGRRCIFLTRSPSPLWHDWQNGKEREYVPQKRAVNEKRPTAYAHTLTHIWNIYPAQIRTLLELFINFLMGERISGDFNAPLRSTFALWMAQRKVTFFMNFRWGEEFQWKNG